MEYQDVIPEISRTSLISSYIDVIQLPKHAREWIRIGYDKVGIDEALNSGMQMPELNTQYRPPHTRDTLLACHSGQRQAHQRALQST